MKDCAVLDDNTVFIAGTNLYNLFLFQLPLNAVVEIIIVDEGFGSSITSHPMHLHGYIFSVVAMGKIGVTASEKHVRRLDNMGLIKRNLVDPPRKDTLAVPTGGYAVIRFVSSNPGKQEHTICRILVDIYTSGFWLYHCHIDTHMETGMSLVFQVGEFEEMLPVPPNLLLCGDNLPKAPNCKSKQNIWIRCFNKSLAKIKRWLSKSGFLFKIT